MKKRNKIIIILAVIAVIVIFVLANLLRSGEKSFKVEVEKVKKGDITSIVTASGKIQAKRNVKISAYVVSKIIDLPVKDGDAVKKGQLLVQLDPARYKAEVEQAEAQMRMAGANLEQAKLVYDRQKQLFEKNLTSQEQSDNAKTSYHAAQAQYDQSKAALAQAQDDLSKTTITAPMDGVITELNAEVGEIVMIGTMNNPGTVIMTISDLSEIEAEVEVDETDVANLELGQEAKISIDAYPDTNFKGKVTEIGNTGRISGYGTQEQVTNFLVKVLLLDEVKGIKPGMSASVDITTDSRKGVLNVPIAAVVLRAEKEDTLKTKKGEKSSSNPDSLKATDEKKKKKEKEGVFVVEKDQAKFEAVKTGISDQQNIEIVSGIKENDQIITGSYKILRNLKDGDKVKIVKKSQLEEKKR
jgi:HlyD family secretion protein